MSQMNFAKPSPARPLEESDWLDRTDRAEVGREPFFCGRDAEFEVFKRAANSLRRGNVGGGSMVFQGAPGAGKTALMQECMEAVRRHSTPEEPWAAVRSAPSSLWAPADMVSDLIDAAEAESRRLSRLASSKNAQKLEKLTDLGKSFIKELSERGFTVAGLSVGGKPDAEKRLDSEMTAARLFSIAAPLLENVRFVVFVDEAQNAPVEPTTQQVMSCLHLDPQGISLVAAFFGLSDTKAVLARCGLSRLADERVVNLEPLSVEDSKRSFRRMLKAYYSGTQKEQALWADALAELSQGWPQHINRVGVAAGRVVRANGGTLKEGLLAEAVERGAERKNAYYDARIDSGSYHASVYRQLAWEARRKEGPFHDTLSPGEIASLTESERGEKGQTADEFIADALHVGVLAPAKGMPGQYKIPIPSFGDYLRSLQLPD